MPTIKQDEAKFSAYQEAFVQELVGIVKIALEDSNLRGAEAKQLANDVAFAVAAFFDGGGDDCSVGDDEFRPVLTFERREEPETLYFCSGGVLHDLVDEAVDQAFKWSS